MQHASLLPIVTKGYCIQGHLQHTTGRCAKSCNIKRYKQHRLAQQGCFWSLRYNQSCSAAAVSPELLGTALSQPHNAVPTYNLWVLFVFARKLSHTASSHCMTPIVHNYWVFNEYHHAIAAEVHSTNTITIATLKP